MNARQIPEYLSENMPRSDFVRAVAAAASPQVARQLEALADACDAIETLWGEWPCEDSAQLKRIPKSVREAMNSVFDAWAGFF